MTRVMSAHDMTAAIISVLSKKIANFFNDFADLS